MSGTLYNIYNSPLLEIANRCKEQGSAASGFIDDVVYLTKGKTFAETNARIVEIMDEVQAWATSANCEFEIDKFALIGFTRRMVPRPFQPCKRQSAPHFAITINGRRIKPVASTKFLGVRIHQNMSWAEQSAAAMEKGTAWAITCRRIATTTKGIPPKYARRLYLTVCIPRMLYVVDVWGTPERTENSTEKRKKIGGCLGRLATIQRQALLQLGAMRTMATDVLEAHGNLLPFHLLLDKVRHTALL
jgi:hypothetical protein